MCAVKWCFDKLGPNEPEDGDATRGNFYRESTSSATTFVRELLQNTLDARLFNETSNKHPARVTINFITPTIELNKKLCGEIIPYIKSIDPNFNINLDSPRALVIEEYGTTGLIGDTVDHRAAGEDERWANFWHREAVPTKTTKSLGRAGQGKITLFMASQLNCLFAVTRRINDDKDYAYGKCIFSYCPKVSGICYRRQHLWGNLPTQAQEKTVQPITDPEVIKELKIAYQLKRNQESGISFIIPYPDEILKEEDLINAVIKDFYYPVFTGGLSVHIGSVDITSTTLKDLIQSRLDDKQKPSVKYLSFMELTANYPQNDIIKILPEWQDSPNLKREYFYDNQFDNVQEKFLSGECIATSFPVKVFPQKEPDICGEIEVFLQYKEEYLQTEDLFIRNGLPIGEERPLQKNAKKCFALVRIDNPVISEFVGYAEEPSHNKWNTKQQEVTKRYNKVQSVIKAIRSAAFYLYNLLRGNDTRPDEDIFIDILSIPNPNGAKKRKKKKNPKPGRDGLPVPPDKSPKHRETFWEFYDINDNSGIGIKSINNDVLQDKLPLPAELEFAYNLLEGDGDPFENWHPFDFDLSDKKQFHIQKQKGITIISQDQNKISFIIEKNDFCLEITGFNPAQQIKVKGIVNDEK